MSASVAAVEFLRRTLAYPDWRGRVLYGLLRGVFALVPIRRKLVAKKLSGISAGKVQTRYKSKLVK